MKNWLFPAVLSTVSVGFLASPAQAFTYTFSTSQPCTFGCTGNVDVMGTIETDGTLGAITPANIVDWEFVFNSPNYSNSILSAANGQITSNNVNLIATETDITFDLFGVSDIPENSLRFGSTAPPPPYQLNYQFQGGDESNSQWIITNGPISSFAEFPDQSVTNIFDGEGGTVVLATREAESVPEPATILGLGLVTAMGLGSSLKRKLGKKNAA